MLVPSSLRLHAPSAAGRRFILHYIYSRGAEGNYEAKSLVLSNQDKMLDLELQQIETQHKAIETEYDSVKKVIENNIKVSFKIFS